MENKIFATCNYTNKAWEIREDGYYAGSFNVVLNVMYDNSTQVRDVKYGVKFYVEDRLVGEESYPKERMAINTLTSGYSVEPCFDFESCKNHKVYLWAEVNGELIEKEIEIPMVLPIQPYPSWTFKNGKWVPPVPEPEIGIYAWDESKRQWILMEDQYMPGAGGSTTDPNLIN